MKKALHEEVQELLDATSVVDQVDALLDAVVFALGGLYKMGLTVEQAHACLDAIMDANMAKKAGKNPSRATEGVIDATKPVDWVPPEDTMHKLLFPTPYASMESFAPTTQPENTITAGGATEAFAGAGASVSWEASDSGSSSSSSDSGSSSSDSGSSSSSSDSGSSSSDSGSGSY